LASAMYCLMIAEKIFGEHEIIINVNHQGLITNSMNEMYLGAHNSLEDCLLPITLKADSPAYITRGLLNFTREQIEENGWTRRASNRGLTSILKHANLMPHGGGYALNGLLNVKKVIMKGNNRRFVCTMENKESTFTISNTNALEFHYRGKRVAEKSFKLGLAEQVALLEPYFVIKF